MRQKGRQNGRGIGILGVLRIEGLVAEYAAVTHIKHLDTAQAMVCDTGDHIQVAPLTADILLFLHMAQGGDLITVAGRFFEVQVRSGGFHARHQFGYDLAVLAFEKQYGMPYILLIGLAVHQADAGGGAAFDLILQARTGAVAIEAVFALAHRKQFLQ